VLLRTTRDLLKSSIRCHLSLQGKGSEGQLQKRQASLRFRLGASQVGEDDSFIDRELGSCGPNRSFQHGSCELGLSKQNS